MWEFLRTGRKCLLLETNKFSFCFSLYIYSIYSRNISWTPTICRHYDKHSDNGEQIAFTIYNVSPVCLAIGSPWESDHGKMVFLELWCSRLDPGPWNVVPLTSEVPVSLFLRSSFPLANCNTVLICERGRFIYSASMSLIIFMMNLISKNRVQEKLDIICFWL